VQAKGGCPLIERPDVLLLESVNGITSLLHHLNIGIPVSSGVPNVLHEELAEGLQPTSIWISQFSSLANNINIASVIIVIHTEE